MHSNFFSGLQKPSLETGNFFLLKSGLSTKIIPRALVYSCTSRNNNKCSHGGMTRVGRRFNQSYLSLFHFFILLTMVRDYRVVLRSDVRQAGYGTRRF